MPNQELNILGTGISCTNTKRAVSSIKDWIRGGQSRFITITGVHGVIESLRSEEVRSAHNNAVASMPDGMPLSWFGWIKGHKEMDRVYGPDLMLSVLEMSAKEGFSSFFYGGDEGVPDKLETTMKKRFAGLKIAGTYSPPFRPLSDKEENEIINRINASGADIAWIGLSTPKQELLMNRWKGRIKAPLMIGVGAAFDFLSGRKKQAPRWIQRAGLEWLFRVCTEPKRLWRRYFFIVPAFLVLASLQLLRLKEFNGSEKQTPAPSPSGLLPRFIILGLLAVSTAALLLIPPPVAMKDLPVDPNLPDSIGNWQGNDIFFCQNEQCMETYATNTPENTISCPACGSEMKRSWSLAESRLLPKGTVLSKKIYEKNNERCLVAIVISGNERVGIHRPQMCLPGQGFKVLSEDSLFIESSQKQSFEIRHLEISPQNQLGGQLDYYYWYTDGRHTTQSHFEMTAISSIDRIFRGRVSRWAYITVAPLNKNSDFRNGELKLFIDALRDRNRSN